MRRSALSGVVAAALAASTALLTAPAASAAPVAPPSTKVDQKVVVLLKHQPAAAPVGSAAATARAKRIAADQAPVVAGAKRAHAKSLKTYTVANAFAATVSAATVADLKADPAVAAVFPDSRIRLAAPAAAAAGSAAVGGAPRVIPGACDASSRGSIDESLPALRVKSDDPKAVTARSLGYTGKGVKVGFLAEGIDTGNVNFLRNPADPSSSAFVDYQDFSGEGTDAPTTGGEAFLDANAIAGQGKHVYDVGRFSTVPQPTACNVRIEGTAPGASLVGLKVFGAYTTTSSFLQAINYAVQTAHVDVLNESFGSNPIPDRPTLDAVVQFNRAAVQAGVTVTASSGDAGPTNTIGSPASDPQVLNLGGSTTYRLYAQDDYGFARSLARTGWLSNNISPLSSGGVTEQNRTVDVVAPGDLSWASCTPDPARYEDCTDYLGNPSDIEHSGGTSESAPLAAGVAALVIEAYAKHHHGAKPSPALIKRILTGTADDLGAPADEQGAGIIDAVGAVRAAAAVSGGARSSGEALLKSTSAISAATDPGTRVSRSVTVTNTSSKARTYTVSGRTLGADRGVRTGSVSLSDASSPKIPGFDGSTINAAPFTFTVGEGEDRLQVDYTYTGTDSNASRVRVILIDPKGRYASHSIPQGVGNHGQGTVLHPVAGKWTGYVTTPITADGGVNQRVPYRIATQRYVSFGSASPSRVRLAPGASRTVRFTASTPAKPGDRTASVVFRPSGGGAVSTVPVTLRSRIDVARGGRFSGVLVGGNGRPASSAQVAFYQFRVGTGVRDVTAKLRVGDTGDATGLYLVSPHGDVQGYGQNSLNGEGTESATAWLDRPVAGIWTLVVAFASPVSGAELRQPFSGSVAFDRVRVGAKGLPNSASTVLPAGQPVTVPVRVTNNGAAPAQFFVDARLDRAVTAQLAPLEQGAPTFPSPDGTYGVWFVPTHTTGLTGTANGSKPVQFDLSPFSGDPDIASRNPAGGTTCGTTASATYTSRDRAVASGLWFAAASECGPYGTGPAPTAAVSQQLLATTLEFDPAVTSTTGNLEEAALDPATEVAPVEIAPGASAVIQVTVTPTGTKGQVVSGALYVDAIVDAVPPSGQLAGVELATLPYRYTIG